MGDNIINVPDHILDKISEEAARYVAKDRDRWLGLFSEEDRIWVEENSTHHVVDTPERRELHRSILQKIAANITKAIPDKPKLIYFIGPMAVGKTTLSEMFDERIKNEQSGHNLTLQDQYLEDAYQSYKEAKQRCMVTDYQLFKDSLPEFKENDNEYAIIRAEASGLAYAVFEWAKELKASIVLESLGDGNVDEWIKEKSKTHEVLAIGVTVDPQVNLTRLHERNDLSDDVISDDELIRTIKGFSHSESFHTVAQQVPKAFLISAKDTGYEVIYAAKNGDNTYVDEEEYAEFSSYSNKSKNDLIPTSYNNENNMTHFDI